MWLDPGLLPGPSLLDLTAANEVAIVGADLSEIEWHRPARESASTEAVRLVRLLRLDSEEPAIVSVGDAEVLHRFLRDARRSSPSKIEERTALAALCRYLQSRDWMPPHLASQYGLRAKAIMPPETVEPKPEVAPREPPEALPPLPAAPPGAAMLSTVASEPLAASVELMTVLARACGHTRLDEFALDDLVTFDRDMAALSGVAYAGVGA